MKRLIFLIVFFFLLIPFVNASSGPTIHKYVVWNWQLHSGGPCCGGLGSDRSWVGCWDLMQMHYEPAYLGDRPQAIKEYDPNIKVLLYRNVRAVYQNYPQCDESHPLWPDCNELEFFRRNGWILKTAPSAEHPEGEEIVSKDYSGNRMVTKGDPEYQEWVANWLKYWVDEKGFDGVLLDNGLHPSFENLWSTMGIDSGCNAQSECLPVDPDTGENRSRDWWENYFYDAQLSLTRKVKDMLPDKLVIANGIWNGNHFFMENRQSKYADAILNGKLDGFMIEGWTSGGSDFYTEEMWKKNINLIVWIENNVPQDKIIIPMGAGWTGYPDDVSHDEFALYSFASLLLGASSDRHYLLQQPVGECGLEHHCKDFTQNLHEIELGDLLNNYYMIEETHVYARDFSKVKVLVNPTDIPYDVSLGGDYETLDGEIISSITMEPHTGAILKNIYSLQSDLIGYWEFDGNTEDSSGNGNDGTVHGATWTTDCKSGSCLDFDGDDDVTIADSPSLSSPAYTKQATWMFWVKFNTLDFSFNWPTFLGKGFAVGSKEYDVRFNNGTKQIFLSLSNGSQSQDRVFDKADWQIDEWYHIAITYEGTTQKVKLYINGDWVDTKTFTINNPLRDTDKSLEIGTSDFNGIMDEVKIWNYALTEEEIKEEYEIDCNTACINQGYDSGVCREASTGTANLIFKSGFESGITITDHQADAPYSYLHGADDTGYDWDDFPHLINYVGGTIGVDIKTFLSTEKAHSGSSRSLKQVVMTPFGAVAHRNELNYHTNDFAGESEIYMSRWLYYPSDLFIPPNNQLVGISGHREAINGSGFGVGFNWANDTSGHEYLYVDCLDYFNGTKYSEHIVWRVNRFDLTLPRGEWFKLEDYIYRHPTNGIYKVWLNGELIFDIKDKKTMNWTREAVLNRIGKIYINADESYYPYYHYIDDIEIWDGLPSGGCLPGETPIETGCGSGQVCCCIGEPAPTCTGSIDLTLSPSIVTEGRTVETEGRTVEASVSGLENCDGKKVYLYRSNLYYTCEFTLPEDSCTFTLIDINGNNNLDCYEEPDECDEETLIVNPAGGGCPTLFVYDGNSYVKERKSRIHSEEGVDTVDEIVLNTKPVVDNGVYSLSLKETTLPEHSHIDNVKLLVDGEEVKLISAWHSRYGDVTSILRESDDLRTDTKVFDSIELKFDASKTGSFVFRIEGYNARPRAVKLDIVYLALIPIIAALVIIVVIFALMKFKAKK